jgi:hypothetical protein
MTSKKSKGSNNDNDDGGVFSGFLKFAIFIIISAIVFFGGSQLERGRNLLRDCGDLPEFCEDAYDLATRMKARTGKQSKSDKR